jgi:hypothetical protein
MALSEAGPIYAALVELMLSESIGQLPAGDHDIEHVLERLSVEFGVLAGGSVIALEARQDDQLSSQRMASRPLRKRLPLPAASSFNDSLSAALNSAIVR